MSDDNITSLTLSDFGNKVSKFGSEKKVRNRAYENYILCLSTIFFVCCHIVSVSHVVLIYH